MLSIMGSLAEPPYERSSQMDLWTVYTPHGEVWHKAGDSCLSSQLFPTPQQHCKWQRLEYFDAGKDWVRNSIYGSREALIPAGEAFQVQSVSGSNAHITLGDPLPMLCMKHNKHLGPQKEALADLCPWWKAVLPWEGV